MRIKKLSNITMLSLLVGILALNSVSFAESAMQNKFSDTKIKEEQHEKPSSIRSEYAELNKAISKMNKGTFNTTKQNIKTAFDEISELIPRILPKGMTLSSSAQGNINNIEKIMDKIDNAKNPEQLIIIEKEGVDAAVSALKDINNRAGSKISNLDKELSSVVEFSKVINVQNYQYQSMITFKKLSSIMEKMNTHFNK